MCIRFNENDVRPTGRASMGVIGMNLDPDDEVVGMQLDTQGEALLIASENGLGKRTMLDKFAVQRRGGKGVKCYKITEKTGNVIGVKAVHEDSEIMLITTGGIIIRMPVDGISMLDRITSGVKLIDIDVEKDIKVASIAKVRRDVEKNTDDEAVEGADGFSEGSSEIAEEVSQDAENALDGDSQGDEDNSEE